MSAPRSNTLFHFTKSLDFLSSIIKNGFFPRYSLEDLSWLQIDFHPIPMVCFCDIPISRISDHTAFYGSYGLGLSKDWGLRNALHPLIYTPNSGAVTRLLNDILNLDRDHINILANEIPIHKHFRSITTLVKPLSGKMIISGSPVEKDFYQENEWRFVPEEFTAYTKAEFSDAQQNAHDELSKNPLKFTPQDVKYIFVKLDSEIPIIFDFIQRELGDWPHNDIKILTSRITSLDTIGLDV